MDGKTIFENYVTKTVFYWNTVNRFRLLVWLSFSVLVLLEKEKRFRLIWLRFPKRTLSNHFRFNYPFNQINHQKTV